MLRVLAFLGLLLAVGSAQAQPTISGGCGMNSSPCFTIPTGATGGRTQADWTADTINVKAGYGGSPGAKGDSITYTDGVATGTAFSSDQATFSASSVGKYILIHGAGSAGIALTTTIAAYVGPHAVTLAAPVVSNITGAVYTYGTDDTSSIVEAIAVASATNKCVYFPPGGYWLASQSSVITLANACLLGDGTSEFGSPYTSNGTVILISNQTTAAFAPGYRGYWHGINVYYPDQDGSASSPIAFPPTFETTAIANWTFDASIFINSYDLFKCDNSASASCLGRVTFTPSAGGYCIDKCFWFLNGTADKLDLTSSNWQPGYYQDVALTGSQYLAKYTSGNGEFIRYDTGAGTYTNIDTIMMKGNIIHGYRYGIRGLSGTLDLSDIDANWDAVPTIFSLEGSASVNSTSFEGRGYAQQVYVSGAAASTFNAMSFTSTANNAKLTLTGFNFAYAQGHCIFSSGLTFQRLTLTGVNFDACGQSTTNSTYDALVMADGGAILNVDGGHVNGATISGSFQIGFSIVNVGLGKISGVTFNNLSRAVSYSAAAGTLVLGGNASSNTLASSSVQDSHTSTAALVNLTTNVWDKSLAQTVAGLPSCGSALEGASIMVMDALTPAYNVTLTGGSSGVIPAFCNGSGWVAH